MTTAMLEKKLKPYEHPVGSEFMRWLLTHMPPRPITSRLLHRGYRTVVGILMEALEVRDFTPNARRELEEYINVVAGLLAEYERKEFPVKDATSAEVLAFLMEQHGLTQEDMAEDMGGQPAVSYVLNGKRDLSKDQIAKLSARFKVSPAVFFMVK